MVNNQNSGQFFKENSGLIHKAVRMYGNSLMAFGVCPEYEDVFAEFSEVFVKAYDKFDESKGFQFSTFFMNCCFNRASAIMRMKKNNSAPQVLSLDYVTTGEEGESSSWTEAIESEEATPEESYIRRTTMSQLYKKASPEAALVIQWAISPPEHFVQLNECVTEYHDFMRITKYVAAILGLTQAQTTALQNELKEIIGELND